MIIHNIYLYNVSLEMFSPELWIEYPYLIVVCLREKKTRAIFWSNQKLNQNQLRLVCTGFPALLCQLHVIIEFWLVRCIVCVLCAWLEWLLWFLNWKRSNSVCWYQGHSRLHHSLHKPLNDNLWKRGTSFDPVYTPWVSKVEIFEALISQ